MANGNGKADDNTISNFPPVSDLAMFLTAVNDIRDAVGTDHDKVPLALFCMLLRDDGSEQFVLGAQDYAVTLIGALEVAKLGLVDYIESE